MSRLVAALFVLVQPVPESGPVAGAGSADGLTFERAEGPAVLARAGAPDLVELSGEGKAGPKGALVFYAVNRVRLTGIAAAEVVVLRSVDGGQSWSSGDPVAFVGPSVREPVEDLSIVQLPDGRLRLYFMLAREEALPQGPIVPDPWDPNRPAPVRPPVPMTPDQPPWPATPSFPAPKVPEPVPPGPHAPLRAVLSAVSDDGVRFTIEGGTRTALEGLEAPDVVYCPAPGGGQWLMFFASGGQTRLARSRDGLAWEVDGVFTAPGPGRPAAYRLLDGRIRILRPLSSNSNALVFDPATGRIEGEPEVRLPGPCLEVSVCPRAAGGYAAVLVLPPTTWK
ncbi:MAG: hypothetical protein IT437_03850 [Phycisphaerales bacterium]|nr:hypothetical protein [Phycisphaerales bacterium]